MRIKFNDKIYRLKEIESGVDSLMELVEEPKYNHGDFLMNDYRLAFILDREGGDGEAYYLFCTDMDGEVRSHMQEREKGVMYCNYLKHAVLADSEATEAIHYGLKSIGKRWNAEKKCIEDIPKRKFKAGDKVMIKDGISSKTHEGVGPKFVSTMDEFIGKKLMVKGYSNDGYVLFNADYFGYQFAEDWLEPWSEELKKGDLAIFWDYDKDEATIRLYDKKGHEYHYDGNGIYWENAIKFESKEQFEKVLRGEI